ncbi:MAG: heavy metal-associated domain-containing protein [Candidatus Nanopelagicales bacterium]
MQTVLLVNGLGCGGCVRGLTTHLTAVDGVADVEVDLVSRGTSTVRVTTDGPVDRAALEQAVTAAGKRLADPV